MHIPNSAFSFVIAGVLLHAADSTPLPSPQGPNTLSVYNPTLQTMSQNITYNVVLHDRSKVAELVKPYSLLPSSDSTKDWWPAYKHPVLVSGSYNTFIEQLGLLIPDSLLAASIYIPYVDRLGDGQTACKYPVRTYIGGKNGQIDPAAVPKIVGYLEGNPLSWGSFEPTNKALNEVQGTNQLTFKAYREIVPNPVSGPAVAPPALQFTVSKVDETTLSRKDFLTAVNQPTILTTSLPGLLGLCQYVPSYFNETFARPFFAQGQVTFYKSASLPNDIPSQLHGGQAGGKVYDGVQSFSGNSESVSFPPQGCKDAAARAAADTAAFE